MPELPAVRRRLVVFLPGFEAIPAAGHGRRFMREARRTAPIYGMSFAQEIPVSQEDGTTVMRIAAESPAGSTETQLLVDSLDAIAAIYAARTPLRRIALGYGALFDFAVTGTALRFARTSWRYLIFYLFPFLLPLLALMIAGAAWHVSGGSPLGLAAGAVASLAIAWVALRYLHLMLVMDDWAFARDLAHGKQPAFEAAIDRLAASTMRRADEGPVDEIVIAAHSMGAMAAVAICARIMRTASPLPPIGMLTVGSSLMKVALHPQADWLRQDVVTISQQGVPWLEVQSLTDPIHFYKSHPLTSLGIADGVSVQVMRVRFREQLDPARYGHIKRDFFAVHRQFVSGVDRASDYAFHAILCGSEPFRSIAARPGLEPPVVEAEIANVGNGTP